jgi:hypothetical protein
MSKSLQANGAAASGQQPAGVVAQYQADATVGTGEAADLSTGVHPYDSGTILGTVPPGKAGLKLVSGVVQRAAQFIADSTAGVTGNALTPTASQGVAVPTPPTGTLQSDGLSSFPGRE